MLPSSIESTSIAGLKRRDITFTGSENSKSISVSVTALQERNTGASELAPSICEAASPVEQVHPKQSTTQTSNPPKKYFIVFFLRIKRNEKRDGE
jgi:hypothetical protein